MAVPSLPLNNGLKIPVIGLGTWQAQDDEVEKAVKIAIDCGYRLIDTALVYANEASVGQAVRDKIQEGVISREDILVTTKLWNIHHSVEDVVPTLQQSLKNLGLDYVDLYLVHWPFGLKSKVPAQIPQPFDSFDATTIEQTWSEMERCVKLGLVKSIGLSNFNISQIQQVLKVATIKPTVNQVECHMMLNQRPLIEFCSKEGIVIEGYAPFGSPSRPHVQADVQNIFSNEKLLQVAKKHNKTTGQIILRYLIQLGVVVLPKSVTPERIKQNLNLFDFEISPEDMDFLSTLDCNMRAFPYLIAKDHPDYPFRGDPSVNEDTKDFLSV